jgi:hypothetical protein
VSRARTRSCARDNGHLLALERADDFEVDSNAGSTLARRRWARKYAWYARDMNALSSIPTGVLMDRMPALVSTERNASAEVIAHLGEIDRRRAFLFQACSSLFSYCRERLGYSEDESHMRVRVTRLAQKLPRALDELRSGAIHLTGLFLLSNYLTPENSEELFAEARGLSRRELEKMIARRFPRPDVREQITPLAEPGDSLSQATRSGTG